MLRASNACCPDVACPCTLFHSRNDSLESLVQLALVMYCTSFQMTQNEFSILEIDASLLLQHIFHPAASNSACYARKTALLPLLGAYGTERVEGTEKKGSSAGLEGG